MGRRGDPSVVGEKSQWPVSRGNLGAEHRQWVRRYNTAKQLSEQEECREHLARSKALPQVLYKTILWSVCTSNHKIPALRF